MKTYEIEDYSGFKAIALMDNGTIIEAISGRKALDIYLKQIGFKSKVKVSGDNSVHFKTTPIVFKDGRKYVDRTKGQRSVWYQIVPEKYVEA